MILLLIAGCEGGSGGAAPGADVLRYLVARRTDDMGAEVVALRDSKPVPIASLAGISIESFSGVSKNAREALSYVSPDAKRTSKQITLYTSERVADRRWIVAIASSVPDRKITLDIEGVGRVEFADGKAHPWPVVFQEAAVALDITYSRDGKVAYINELLREPP